MAADSFLSEALGVSLCDGSFNLFLEGEHRVFGQHVDPAACRRAGVVMAIPCTVGGISAFLLNTDVEKGRAGIAGPTTLFELFSSVKLRDHLGVKNGDRVELVFDPAAKREYRPTQ